MAENVTNTNVTTDNAVVENNTPSVDELMAQIASLTADRDKYKTANDNLSKENANYKRAERANKTETENQITDLQEQIANLTQRAEEAESLNNRNTAIASYKTMDEKTVDKLIEAVANADHSTIGKIIDNAISDAVKKAQEQWLADRPRVNAGVSGENAMSKEDILAIKDAEERQRLIAANIQLFR